MWDKVNKPAPLTVFCYNCGLEYRAVVSGVLDGGVKKYLTQEELDQRMIKNPEWYLCSDCDEELNA